MAIRRSICKGSFIDAFLMKMRENPNLIPKKKVVSRSRATILPGWLDSYVRVINGKTRISLKFGESREVAMTRKPRKQVVAEKNVKLGKKN